MLANTATTLQQHCNNTATTGKQMKTRKFDSVGSHTATHTLQQQCKNTATTLQQQASR